VTGGAAGAAHSGRRKEAHGVARPGGRRGARVLAVDVGTGTADVLLTLPGEPLENAVKLVVPSRTRVVGAQIAEATRGGQTVLFTGPIMGGGPCGRAMKRHLAAGQAFVATGEAALSFTDDLDKVRALGARIVSEEAAAELAVRMPEGSAVEVRSGDLDPGALCDALELLGADPHFDAVAVAVQDHGFSPDASNRVFRFAFWEAALEERRPIGELFYDAADAPADFTRLRAAAALATGLARGGPALVADTGPAALYGSLPEGIGDAVLVNAGNGHTICVVTLGGRLAGIFEHHTSALDAPRLEDFLHRFLAGGLDSDEVRGDGGHGAVMGVDAQAVDLMRLPMYATGPRRALLAGSTLPLEYAAPHGDMMLTGCFGLLRAFADRGVTPDGDGVALSSGAREL
jgi:uncharacterized protein (DUF1786 family)